MTENFSVHPKLSEDCTFLAEWGLCQVLLMNDSRFPWLILVPQRSDLRDLHEIDNEDRLQLFQEIEICSRALQKIENISKINVAALGNQVPQLHVHVIGRSQQDEAWPGPVWGVGEVKQYSEDELARRIDFLIGCFATMNRT